VTDFKQTIISIVNQHGESIDSDFALDIDADSNAVMDLSIERHGDELIVCQYSADGTEIAEYLQTWARNLQSQGFLDK